MIADASGRALLEDILDHGWHRSPEYDADGCFAWVVHLHGQENYLILVHQDTGAMNIRAQRDDDGKTDTG